MKTCLFIFRRDLRLDDNTGLINCLKEFDYVIPLFIVTPEQVSNTNKLRSSNCIQFMMESIEDLDGQINKANNKCGLWIEYGNEIDVIERVYSLIKFTTVSFNRDYSPYSIKRDKHISSWCNDNNVKLIQHTDILLVDDNIYDIKARNGNTYYVFNMFYKKALTMNVRKPRINNMNNYVQKKGSFKNKTVDSIKQFMLANSFYSINNELAVRGGTRNGNKILSTVKRGLFDNYEERSNMLDMETTRLSAHNKFGTVSIRRVYNSFDRSCAMQKQLYWRDYYYYLSIHVKDFYKYIHLTKQTRKYSNLWSNDVKLLTAWKNGQTGYPVVDAAMTEMNTTGFMHNRARLIVSEFLVKILMINWKYGERYFTTKLVDIDRAQNMGNWNWSSSFGLDASPYLRIFNTWTQSSKFDPDCSYIKKWLPELTDIPPNHIHKWYKYCDMYNVYRKPIVDYDKQRKIFISKYKKTFI